jgi:5,10-methylenetetrahydromethanopterin reductase
MMRFGISRGVSPRETFTQVGEIAKEVENLGFDMLWFVDHQLGMKDVYAAMNVAALNTSRIEIGSAVTQLQTRHPTVTANATSALDELSKGRAILGLGAGWVSVRSIGLEPNKVGEIRDGIKLLRRLFAGEVIDFNGVEGQLATARRQIPIYLAVSQPAMLRMCGEICDGAILMGAADPEFCKWQLDYIYQGLEKGKRNRGDIVIDLIVTMSIDEDEQKAIGDVRAWATSQAATFDVWKHMPPAWERYRPQFRRAAEEYHYKDHLSLHAEHKQIVSDEFTQSVAVAGNLSSAIERLEKVAALDIDRITFALLSGGRQRRLRQLASDVVPALQARANVGERVATR